MAPAAVVRQGAADRMRAGMRQRLANRALAAAAGAGAVAQAEGSDSESSSGDDAEVWQAVCLCCAVVHAPSFLLCTCWMQAESRFETYPCVCHDLACWHVCNKYCVQQILCQAVLLMQSTGSGWHSKVQRKPLQAQPGGIQS